MMDALVIAVGVVALLAGVTLFLRSRRGADTNPTTLVAGLSLALLGYHLVAWTLPERWFPLQIPAAMWPLVVGGVAVAISGALVADALERRSAPDSAARED